MSGFVYSLGFRLLGTSSVTQAASTVGRLDNAVNRATQSTNRLGSAGLNAGNNLHNSFQRANGSLGGLLGRLATAATVVSSLQGAAEAQGFDTAVKFLSGTDAAYKQNITFLDQTVDRLKLLKSSAQEGFKTLLGSVRGSGLSMQQTRDTFYAVSEAATVLGLSGDNVKGIYTALGQMAGKGKVSAEELRGQLGERLYGAFTLAAQGMGITTGALDKLLEQGKLSATNFLPKFALELHKSFGGGVAEAIKGAQANFNAFENSIFDLRVTFGKELMPTVLQFMNGYLIPAVHWIGQNISTLTVLGSVIGGLVIGYKVYSATMGLTSLLTGGFTGAVWALNAAFWANPIGFVVGVLAALSIGVVYAWNKFESFRGFLVGGFYAAIEAVKFGLQLWFWPLIQLWKIAIPPIMDLWKKMEGFRKFLTGAFFTALKWLKSYVEFLIKPFLILGKFIFDITGFSSSAAKAGKEIGKKYNEGWNRGAKMTGQKPESELVAPDGVSDAFKNVPNAGGLGNDGKIKKGIDEITGGGKETKNITINLGKLMDQVVIQSTTVKEGAGELREIILRELLQVLNTANQTQ